MTHAIKTQSVVCGGGLPAYVAVPTDVTGKVPVMIVMHERYGFTDNPMKPQAERFAREDGYVVMSPDFFYKHNDQDALHRGDTTYDMTDPESLVYFDEAVNFLKTVPQADLGKLTIMGVCQTGRHPLVYAAARPLAAALVWYGAAQPREFQVNDRYPVGLDQLVKKIDCPVLGHFGEDDHIISIDDVRKLRGALEAAGKSFTMRIYRDAPHGWLNDAMPGRYRRNAAEAALADQRTFLAEVLAPDYDRSRCVQQFYSDISTGYDFSQKRRQA